MYAGKRCNDNPISTKRSKLDGVGPVDNRPSTNKDGGRFTCAEGLSEQQTVTCILCEIEVQGKVQLNVCFGLLGRFFNLVKGRGEY